MTLADESERPTPAPEPIRRALRALHNTEISELRELHKVLLGASPESPSDLRRLLRGQIPGLNRTEVKDIASFLSAMGTRQWTNEAGRRFLREASRGSDLELDPEFIETLLDLVATRPLSVYGRAVGLQYEYPNVLMSSRVLTDIRPVFSETDAAESTEIQILAGTIVHSLRLEYATPDTDLNSIYLSLDKSDLMAMQTVISRALEKNEALSKYLKSSSVPLIEPWQDSDELDGGDDE